MTSIGCLHTIGSLSVSRGGPSRSVPALCRELQNAGVEVQLIAAAGSPGDLDRLPAELRQHTVIAPRRSGASFRRIVASALAGRSGLAVHDHGIWLASNHQVAKQSRLLATPRIVSLRGMLAPPARRHRAWRKDLAWRFYQRRDLEGAAVLHATSDREAQHLCDAGMRQPIVVIPNGVALPPLPARGDRGRQRTALFLGRVHPLKGLLRLVEAWAVARPSGWRMVIAGPDVAGHRAAVETAVARSGLGRAFRFVGELGEAQKRTALEQADLLVLPSDSESFGVAVAEALASGLPVITTRGTPWQEVEERRCGWWVEPTAEALAGALARAAGLDRQELEAMGERGRRLVEERYSWPTLAGRMAAVYAWMLGAGPPPDCIWPTDGEHGTGGEAMRP